MTLLDLDSPAAPAPQLPSPGRQRWQPLRAGLVDLFHYYEEFHFRDGHLLLHGHNGTGKYKVLALLLPFLLDGDTSPHRVEPDGDPGKGMEWNLLLGGRHPHPERTGYSWIEFGRLDDDGTPRFTTLGIGLRAVQGRPVATWFFVTSQRVGAELFLLSAARSPLRADALVEAVGEAGVVVHTAERYRRAVNEALFDLAPERYDALLTLLVQLRQPALSKRPDERRLSAALTEALPPLDPAVVADVADAFRSLEEEKAALTSLTEARDATSAFVTTYTAYARIAARRRAAQSRTPQRAVEAELSEVDDSDTAWGRATRLVQGQVTGLGEVLSRSGDALAPLPTDHGIVVTATWRGRELPVGDLRTGLEAELADRERLLSAKERTLLENHLVSDVAARLQDLIRAAEAEVAAMNRSPRYAWATRPAPGATTCVRRWTTGAGTPSGSSDGRTAGGARRPARPPAASGCSPRPSRCLRQPRRTTPPRATRTRRGWCCSTRPSPAWTTTAGPSASGCSRRSTWTTC